MSFDSTSFAHAPEGKGIPALFERWMLDELAWDLKGAVERFEGAGKRKDHPCERSGQESAASSLVTNGAGGLTSMVLHGRNSTALGVVGCTDGTLSDPLADSPRAGA